MAELRDYGLTEGTRYEALNTRSTIFERIDLSTARLNGSITIHFKKGASHVNWMNGDRFPSWLVTTWNLKGTSRAVGRPLFEYYEQQRGWFIEVTLKSYITHGKGRIKDRCKEAGDIILKDLISWVESGGFDAHPNQGTYAELKMIRFHHTNPMWATGALMNDLEVVIEGFDYGR